MKKSALYALLLFVVISKQLSFAQNHKVDSLLTLLKVDKEDTNRARHLYKVSNEYRLIEDYDKSLTFSKQALALAQKLNYKRGIASNYRMIGFIYEMKYNYPEALKNFSSAINARNEIKNNTGIEESYGSMGDIYYYQCNYPEALKYYFISLKICEESKDKARIAGKLNNIGAVYYKQVNYSEALKYYSSALNISEEIGDKFKIAECFLNIGIINDDQGNYKEALKKYLVSLNLSKEIKDKEIMASSYGGIATIYAYFKKYSDALEKWTISLKLREEMGDEDGIANTLISIGQAYIELNKVKEAEFYLNKSLILSKKIVNKERIKESYQALSVLDSTTGNYKAAYEHYKLYLLYRDSLNNEETRKKIIQTAMQYEFDKKEAATKYENDKVILKLENENKLHKQQRLIFVGFIILALILLFFAKRAYDNKKKYSEILSQESERKEILLQEVHHRVNNSLQMISSLLSIQADNTTNDEVREYLLKSENRVHAMSAMHELLFESNTKLEVNIQAYLLKVIGFYANVLESKPNLKLKTQIPEATFHSKIALPLALIVNELITNAIKYGFPNNIDGVISISLSRHEESKDVWKLKISDTGIGLPNAKNPEKENSLGLRLVHIMTEQIGGVLSIMNQQGAYFEITFNGGNHY